MHLLYIDPGTGSMLFSVFIGLAAASYFLFRNLLIRIKTLFLGKNRALKNKSAFVIYNEANHYWPVFQPIAREFENRGIDVQYLTSSETDPVFQNDFKYVHPVFIGEGNKAFASLNFLEADVCLMTTPGLDIYHLKRSKLCGHYSHIAHDTGDLSCYRLYSLDWFDSILLTGEYQISDLQLIEKKRNIKQKEFIVTGCTYLDYYDDKLKNLPADENHDFTVLVSPSWGPGALLGVMGDKLLDALKGTGWRVIVRPHPQSKKSETEMLKNLEEKYSDYIWDYESENIGSLRKADIMISDFSSVVFDYVFLFNKPVIYHNAGFIKEMTDAKEIENEAWKFKVIKKIGIEINKNDLPKIKHIIEKAVSDASLSAERIAARETAWQNRGQSGKAVVDSLVEIRNSFI